MKTRSSYSFIYIRYNFNHVSCFTSDDEGKVKDGGLKSEFEVEVVKGGIAFEVRGAL